MPPSEFSRKRPARQGCVPRTALYIWRPQTRSSGKSNYNCLLRPHPLESLNQPELNKVSDLTWSSVGQLPKLAFDHKEILKCAVQRLRSKASYSNIVYGLMPEHFRLSELQKMYEIIIDDKLDKRNFRKRMLATGLLQETGKKDILGAHRPAMLYQFKKMEITFFN